MQIKQSVLTCTVAAALAAMSGAVSASGFALLEQNASGLGDAFAGGAASAEDASTIFFNPAGMSQLQGKQISVGVSAIKPSAKFSDNGASAGAVLQTPGGDGGDAGSLAWLPNVYFSMEVNPALHVGLGINAPFGLQTEYDPNWIGRFQAIQSKIETVNLNPAVSYQVNDDLSIGGGLNYQRITGNLTSAVNYSAAAFGAGGAGLLSAIGGPGIEGVTSISASDSAWGYNFGVLFKVNPQTRVGLAYRSKIKYNLTGTINFTAVPTLLSPSPLLQNGAVTLPLTMPDTFSVSAFHQLNDKWDVMADATRTGWGVLQQLAINTPGGVQSIQENWKNTWRVSVGANYHYSEQWTSRVGVAFDQSPVSDTNRTARIPDNNRTWLSVGGQYKVSKTSALDFGYAHLFVPNASIANLQAAAGQGNLVGTYSDSVDILSVQYTHGF
jgi:long-chain fatty acid transport protein